MGVTRDEGVEVKQLKLHSHLKAPPRSCQSVYRTEELNITPRASMRYPFNLTPKRTSSFAHDILRDGVSGGEVG